MTPRSWVMKITDMPRCWLQTFDQFENLRLNRDVERRSGLVGDQHVGAARERDGDQYALSHPAGKLVRIVVEPTFRRRNPHLVPAARQRVVAAPRASPTSPCRRSISINCIPTRCTGFSAVIGSWKIIEMRRPRISLHRIGRQLQQVLRRSAVCGPATTRPAGFGNRPMIDSAVTLLPQPDSPTTPSVLPATRSKLTPSTTRTVPSSPTELGRQRFDPKHDVTQGRARRYVSSIFSTGGSFSPAAIAARMRRFSSTSIQNSPPAEYTPADISSGSNN